MANFFTDYRANVKEYGAKGNGKADDTAAIQKAINACATGVYTTVYLPRGKYKITKTLLLPEQVRPNTSATQGTGFKIIGDGMYDSGLIYTGSDYAIFSNKDIAETILFQDFYINHGSGGGICLPQGAHQMFERFFSSACGEGKYGVYIQGLRSGSSMQGYGSYMLSFRNCRFWQETGYLGTGVKLEDVALCTEINNCFFSRSVRNYPHLELVNCYGVHITSSAFERSEQSVPPANPSTGRTEEMVKIESQAANRKMTAPLIKLDNSHSISILDSHAEATYETFVGIYNHSSKVIIDGCRLDHYAITDYNPNKGYIVTVDPGSISSTNIIVGPRNYRVQSNHPNTTHGPVLLDPVGCVVVMNFEDNTPFRDSFYLTERRTVPVIGGAGTNLLKNPGLFSSSPTEAPVEADSGFTFAQLPPSGCRVKQSLSDVKQKIRMYTSEQLDKYDFYTFVLVGSNNAQKSSPIFVDLGGDTNDLTLILPSGSERFTINKTVRRQSTNIVDIVVYEPVDFNIYAVYVLPNIVNQIPYGAESTAVSKMIAVISETAELAITPTSKLPHPSIEYRGKIIRIEGGSGVPDILYICKKNAEDNYEWVSIG